MTSVRPPFPAFLVLVSLGATSGGCATTSMLDAPTPSEIPRLEARMVSAPDDLDTGLRLIAAYRTVERYDEGTALAERLTEIYPDDLGLLVLTGLLAEDRGDPTAARMAYEAVLEADPGRGLGAQMERRLSVVRMAELRADVAAAIEREAELAAPDPATVGVWRFAYEGGDAEWEPLAVALSELLATDLGVTGRLTVVERLRVQAILNEIALGEGGLIDPSTAARSGRLLGSGHIIQGRLRVEAGQEIGVDAAVVEVGAPGAEQVDPVTAQDVLERFFDLEKQLAFDVHAELGVQLTPAERERINERQTESIEALLAFGRGLQAADAGNHALAAQHFAEAEALDPSFTLAEEQRIQAEAVSVASEVPTSDVANAAQQLAQQREAVQQLQSAPTSVPQQVLQNIGESQRSVLAEVTGQDRIGQITLLELILRPPGGGQ